MAKKEEKMLQLKKEEVAKRLTKVEIACKDLIKEKSTINYKNIAEKTGIPAKTLERQPYRDIIIGYRNKNTSQEEFDREKLLLQMEIKRKNQIIEQLVKENHGLKTELLLAGKI